MIGKLVHGYVEAINLCDICGKSRNVRNHDKCSKIRQRKHEEQNARETELKMSAQH